MNYGYGLGCALFIIFFLAAIKPQIILENGRVTELSGFVLTKLTLEKSSRMGQMFARSQELRPETNSISSPRFPDNGLCTSEQAHAA